MRQITASATDLLPLCQYPWRDDAPDIRDEPGPAAVLGTRVHKLIECTLLGQAVFSDSETGPYYQAWLDGWWTSHQSGRWHPELAFGYNLWTGESRVLSLERHRGYPDLGPYWVFATIDALKIVRPLTTIPAFWIIDWKTGAHVPEARASAQLKTQALCLATAYGVRRGTAEIYHVRPAGEPVKHSSVDLDEFDLRSWADTLLWAAERIDSAEPNPGQHCDTYWCKLKKAKVCPSWKKRAKG